MGLNPGGPGVPKNGISPRMPRFNSYFRRSFCLIFDQGVNRKFSIWDGLFISKYCETCCLHGKWKPDRPKVLLLLFQDISILQLILLKNDSFDFFDQGLYWQNCTFRCWMILILTNILFSSFYQNLYRLRMRKGPFFHFFFSIFKPKLL